MDILKKIAFVILLFIGNSLRAEDLPCSSADEFKKALLFLDSEKSISIPEKTKVDLSLQISEGCTGAADRFEKIYETLQKIGVDQQISISTAVSFSKLSVDQVDSFIQIFKRLYLAEYFDSDFQSAFKISLELSQNLKANNNDLRNDFLKIVELCLRSKDFQIGIPRCVKVSVDMARLSPQYPKGLSKDFEELYLFLRNTVALDVDSSLKILGRVLAKGPRASENFQKAYNVAIKRESLGFGPQQAVGLALKVASQTTVDHKEAARK